MIMMSLFLALLRSGAASQFFIAPFHSCVYQPIAIKYIITLCIYILVLFLVIKLCAAGCNPSEKKRL